MGEVSVKITVVSVGVVSMGGAASGGRTKEDFYIIFE